MYKVARESKKNREVLFTNTAEKKGMHPAIIEKDFWVCFLLELLFHQSEYAKYLSFKGGTSLSKGYQAIQRFSEDIDIIMNWTLLGYTKDEPWLERSNTKQDQFNKAMGAKTEQFLKAVIMPSFASLLKKHVGDSFDFYITESDPQTINFVYPQLYKDESILQEIRLEIGALAAWTPVCNRWVTPYSCEEYPKVFQLPKSLIRMVGAKRTFWEKATILHSEANRVNGQLPDRYSRHYYDLFMLSHTEIKVEAFQDTLLLDAVVRFKEKFYRSPWSKYDDATVKSIKLMPPENSITNLEVDYRKMQGMIFGEKIPFNEIMEGIKSLEKEIHHLL